MATTKKKTPPKKVSTAKNTKAAARPWSWRFSILTIGIYTIAVATAVVIALSASQLIATHKNQERLDRIQTIYSSINLDDTYQVRDSSVFGDKRVYSYDKGRSQSSRVEYVHADTVSNTVADLDAKIKSAGFTFIDEPYPGGVGFQYHYKSAKGEYIRLNVTSKPYDDAVYNAFVMDKNSLGAVVDGFKDKNIGPSSVTIKVNLDDNNE